jgi:diadenosine tetraphosphate (Ap4A) HIT family hydrolase
VASPSWDCIFCAIAAGDAPASCVHRDERVVAFVDIRPVNPGHLLVVPRAHAALVTELDPEDWLRVCEVGRRLDAAVRALPSIRCEAVNLFVADGRAAGQEVAHAHLHVIPRFDGDGFGLRHAPGYGAALEPAQAEAMAGAVREVLELESATPG